MKDVEKRYKEKLSELLDIIAEQDERLDLSYRQDEEKKLIKEVRKLADKLPKEYWIKG